MQTENRLFSDLARMASGALGTLGGLRDEVEARVKERVERLANEMDLVTREEFDAVAAMAAKARAGQERLEAKVAELEAGLRAPRPAAAGSAPTAGADAPDRRGGAADKAGSADGPDDTGVTP